MIELVAFDLWDTLIFLEEGWRTFTQLKSFIRKDSTFWREKVKPFYLFKNQESPETFLEDIRANLGIDLTSKARDMQTRLARDLRDTRIYSDVISTLDKLKRGGKKLTVVSNQCSFFIPSFYALRLNRYFNYVLFSCELGYGKPDNRIYRELLRLSEVKPSEILFVGDNKYQDCDKPLELGFRAVHLDRKGLSGGSIQNLMELEGIIQ